MALPNPAPLPPELVDDTGRPSDDEFAELFEAAAADVIHGGANPAEVVMDLADSEGAPAWTVTDKGSAEWAMRHVVIVTAELAELKAQANDWAERIDYWFTRASAQAAATQAFFEHHLKEYAIEERARTDGKVKSVVLPSGRVSTTGPKPGNDTKVVVADEAKVLAWAKAEKVLDDVAPPKPRSVLLKPLRALVMVAEHDDGTHTVLTLSGEPVPGCAVELVAVTAKVTAEQP